MTLLNSPVGADITDKEIERAYGQIEHSKPTKGDIPDPDLSADADRLHKKYSELEKKGFAYKGGDDERTVKEKLVRAEDVRDLRIDCMKLFQKAERDTRNWRVGKEAELKKLKKDDPSRPHLETLIKKAGEIERQLERGRKQHDEAANNVQKAIATLEVKLREF